MSNRPAIWLTEQIELQPPAEDISSGANPFVSFGGYRVTVDLPASGGLVVVGRGLPRKPAPRSPIWFHLRGDSFGGCTSAPSSEPESKMRFTTSESSRMRVVSGFQPTSEVAGHHHREFCPRASSEFCSIKRSDGSDGE